MATEKPNQVWLLIPGFEQYEINNYGEVRRVGSDKLLYQDWSGRNRLKYKSVRLHDFKGGRKKLLIHKLVYCTFIGLVPEDHYVDHINRDNLDNRLENLRCVTFEENQANRDIGQLEKDSFWDC